MAPAAAVVDVPAVPACTREDRGRTTAPAAATGSAAAPSAEDFGERLFGAVLGAQLVQAVHLGDRLGFHRALARADLTPGELAVRTGTAERYARERLEHQAVAGVLTVDDPPRRRTSAASGFPAPTPRSVAHRHRDAPGRAPR